MEEVTEIWMGVGTMETSEQSHNPLPHWRNSSSSLESAQTSSQQVDYSATSSQQVDCSAMSSQQVVCSAMSEASINSLRVPQMNSGLFDSDYTDVTSALVASVDDIAMTTNEAPTMSQADLFTITGEDAQFMLDGTQAVDSLNDALNFDLEGAFLDQFINLENILNGNVVTMDTEPVAEVASTLTVMGGASRVSECKRKAKTRTEEIPVDHSAYTTSSKRMRHNSTMSTDTDSEVSSTTITTPKEKYIQKRMKNNIASKRSRETRKQKYVNLDQQAIDLEQENAKLRVKITELEELAKEMKEVLIQRMVAK